jgi:para-nitrobenzyl esterase
MVAALEWVRDNIEKFGGDSGNVTIMGQSGGGSKVCTLAAMPGASGLIHKVVPLSGSATSALDQDVSRKLGELILKEAGLTPSQVDRLQDIPWKDYIIMADRAAQKFAQISSGSRSFAPVADGVNIPTGTFFSSTSGVSSTIPMLICSTFHEWTPSRDNPELEKITLPEVKERLAQPGVRGGGLGDRAGEVVDAYAKVFPDARPIEVLALISSSRRGVVSTADAKSVQKAPVYMAWFGWEPPLFDNRMRAFHCVDICFWFYNTDLMLTHTGGGKRPRELSERMSSALIQFMKTGDPNGPGIPEWPTYTPEKGETMIFNDQLGISNDPDREAREN